MKITGIYAIVNTKTGDAYVGSSTDVMARWSYHKCVLEKGYHKNKRLQAAYNTYGYEAFHYTILAECEPQELIGLETLYTNEMGTYNISIGRKHGTETKQKIARSHTGKKHTPETRRKISESLKKKVYAVE